MLHDILSRHLGMPEHRVRVINKDVGRLVRPQDPHLSRRDRDLRAGGDARPAREVPRRSHRVVPDGHPLARPPRHRGGRGQARRDHPRDAPRRPRPRRALLDVSAHERRRVRPDPAPHARPLSLARLRGARPRGVPEQDADVPVPRRRPSRRRAGDGGDGRSRRARAVARSRRRAAPKSRDRRHVPVHRAHRALLREALARGVARRGARAVRLPRALRRARRAPRARRLPRARPLRLHRADRAGRRDVRHGRRAHLVAGRHDDPARAERQADGARRA